MFLLVEEHDSTCLNPLLLFISKVYGIKLYISITGHTCPNKQTLKNTQTTFSSPPRNTVEKKKEWKTKKMAIAKRYTLNANAKKKALAKLFALHADAKIINI